MKEKYIKLLLERCLNLNSKRPLLISYDEINEEFVKEVVNYAKNLNIIDIYLDKKNAILERDMLMDMSVEEINNCEYFDESVWDEYASKDAAFLILITEFPNIMNNVDSSKIALASKKRRNSRQIYRKRTLNNEIPWCIAVLPNEYWAKDLFPNSSNPLSDFWNFIEKICLLDKIDSISSWNDLLKEREEQTNRLNNLNIKKLHYKNSLGTNLTVELPDNALWSTANESKWIVNMPSYEIFTTPDFRKTEGTVFSSKPLIYNGKTIDQFYIKFKDGKVVDFNAKVGEDALKEIIYSDNYSSYLGESALVNYNSPISNTNIVFKTTLLDENASCHLALGAGFNECVENGINMNEKDLLEKGINPSKTHVDFMIGTSDLEIVAETLNGNITIMKDGNLII